MCSSEKLSLVEGCRSDTAVFGILILTTMGQSQVVEPEEEHANPLQSVEHAREEIHDWIGGVHELEKLLYQAQEELRSSYNGRRQSRGRGRRNRNQGGGLGRLLRPALALGHPMAQENEIKGQTVFLLLHYQSSPICDAVLTSFLPVGNPQKKKHIVPLGALEMRLIFHDAPE
eukprot:maker-scaffold593_size129216-snap-gene-0.23 protein:Tk12031 transcript:maker-scaffold593_size129216-snap-gene-0.23-mRNA-1 annotation:"peptidyl-prolyl cis-trans isomerase-like 2"